jgi:hypothetical protein
MVDGSREEVVPNGPVTGYRWHSRSMGRDEEDAETVRIATPAGGRSFATEL